jgi:hypothetical protein
MNPALDRRIRERRARVLVRSWDYRQRRHARGMWFRLRRVLADANAAFAISREDATRLMEEGCRAEPVGDELEPPKLIVFTRAERVAQIATARAVPVRLGPELLEAECLALTPFETTRP